MNHELRVAQVAAKNQISIDAHEPVKDTGLRRTWPNMLSREGARGQEFNAWGRPTNPPEHLTILPFTRLLAGPMDFTPGIFDLTFGKTDVNERVQSTLATQLALVRADLQPRAHGRGPARELREAARRLPVHPRRAHRLGDFAHAAGARSATTW